MELVIPIFLFALLALLVWGVTIVMKKNPNMGVGAALTLLFSKHQLDFVAVASIAAFILEGFVGATAETERAEINPIVRALSHTLVLAIGILSVYGLSNYVRNIVTLLYEEKKEWGRIIASAFGAILSMVVAITMPMMNMYITAHAVGQMHEFEMARYQVLSSTATFEAAVDYYGHEIDYNPVELLHTSIFIQVCLTAVHFLISIGQIVWIYTSPYAKEFSVAAGAELSEDEKKRQDRAKAKATDDKLKTPSDPAQGPKTAGAATNDTTNTAAKPEEEWKKHPSLDKLTAFLKFVTGSAYKEEHVKKAISILNVIERSPSGASAHVAAMAKISGLLDRFKDVEKKRTDKVYDDAKAEEELERISKEAKLWAQKGVNNASGEKGLGFSLPDRKKP